MEFRVFEPPRETEIRLKNRKFDTSKVALTENECKGKEFGLEQSQGSKTPRLEKSRFHCNSNTLLLVKSFWIPKAMIFNIAVTSQKIKLHPYNEKTGTVSPYFRLIYSILGNQTPP